MLLKFFNETFTWFMIFILLINMQQRKYPHGNRKKKAVLVIGSLYLTIYILVILTGTTGLPLWTEWIALAIGVILFIIFRKSCFPFKRKCQSCGKKLKFDEWLGIDENLCTDCYYEKHPDEKKKEEEKKPRTEEQRRDEMKSAERVDDIDWDLWEAEERCTLCYIVDKESSKILLIEKKRGMGTGYLNGPGGHIELEETSVEAAIRETKEETGLDVDNLRNMGRLRFQFKEGTSMVGYIFYTETFSGELKECDEAKPGWYELSALDYSRMWEDDRLWLPAMLEGKIIEGYFIFDNDNNMLDYKLDVQDPPKEDDD